MTPIAVAPLPRTAARSAQLVAASERMTLDPFVDVDWTVPLDDGAFHLPPEWLPLYGTPAWDAMDAPTRIAYSRHECAALCGAGIWFENMLMQAVLRHLTEIPVRAGTPCYAPPPSAHTIESLRDLPGGRALSYLLILAVEEVLDAANRATMKDERVHPTSRQIAKLHVLEEARHVSFAKTYLAEVWPTLSSEERDGVVALAPIAVGTVADLTVDPAVYDELGIADGAAVARANPHHRARVVEGLAKLTAFLTDLGVIDASSRETWQELGLVA